MGICNCNEREQMIVYADYLIPNSEKYNSKNTANALGGKEYSQNHDTAMKSMISGNSNNYLKRVSKRESLFHKISEKSESKNSHILMHQTSINTWLNDSKKRKGKKDLECTIEENEEHSNIFSYSHQITQSDKDNIFSWLSNHFWFKDIKQINLYRVIDNLKIYEIEDNVTFFNEGEEGNCMFIVIKGKVEMYKTGSANKEILNSTSSLGEWAIIEDSVLRTYSAKSLSKTVFTVIYYDEYQKIRQNHENTLVSNYETILGYINEIPMMSYLDDIDKDNLCKLTYSLNVEANKSNINLSNCFYIVNSGELICIKQGSKKKKTQMSMKKRMYNGMRNLLLNEETPWKISTTVPTSLFIITRKAFIEIWGIDYQYQLIYPYFKYLMTHNDFFSKLFNELQLVPIYNLFNIKEYQANTVILQKQSNNKIIIIWDGELKYTSKNKEINYDMKVGQIYGIRLITSQFDLESEINVKINTILIECEWEDMKSKIKDFNSVIVNQMKKLSLCPMMQIVNESKLIEIASIIKEESFKKGDYIIQKGKVEYNTFYIVIKGEAKLRLKNKTIRRYGVGNCFGEVFIWSIQDKYEEVIAASDEVICFIIENNYFWNLISETIFNDFIKHKMCNEDKEVKLSDLFINLRLGFVDNWIQVHNKMELYIVKHYPKTEDNFDKVKNELYVNKHWDCAFILKIVKYLHNVNTAIIWYENKYSPITLAQYIKSNTFASLSEERQIVTFLTYAIILIRTVSYIHKKKFVCRTILPDNILIDNQGRWYLFNLYMWIKPKSKKPKINIEGNKEFAAPEILKGGEYTQQSDYWNVGVILYSLYTGISPTLLDQKEVDLNQIGNTQVNTLLKAWLQRDPKKRVNSFHDFFKWDLLREIEVEDYWSYHKYNDGNPKYKDDWCNIELKGKNEKLEKHLDSLKIEDYCDNTNWNWDSIY